MYNHLNSRRLGRLLTAAASAACIAALSGCTTEVPAEELAQMPAISYSKAVQVVTSQFGYDICQSIDNDNCQAFKPEDVQLGVDYIRIKNYKIELDTPQVSMFQHTGDTDITIYLVFSDGMVVYMKDGDY